MSKRPSLLSALLLGIMVIALLVWAVSAFTNEDPLWFVPYFGARADWITVYWDGEIWMFFPGDAGYEEVLHAFADGVGRWAGYEPQTALSPDSLEMLRAQWRLVEFHYNDPVQVHTRHPYPAARVFFVPLTGPHAEWRRVFSSLQGDAGRAGALILSQARFERLTAAVEQAVSGQAQP